MLSGCQSPLDFTYRSNVQKVQSALDEIKPPLSTWRLADEGVATTSGPCFNWGGCPTASRRWKAVPPVHRTKLVALFESAGWTVLTIDEYNPGCIPVPGSRGSVSGRICRITFERGDLYARLNVLATSPTTTDLSVGLSKYDK